jgi:23S rRNA pseudouridine1911/1915/1917 synthase
VVLPSSESRRLDLYIAETLRLMRRSQIKARRLQASVNGKKAKYSHPVKAGDEIRLAWEDAPAHGIIPEDIPLNIVYEDERVIVVNKPQGLVVHPGAGNASGTLANALLWRLNQKRGGGVRPADGTRPFIVHRLDKDTSGLLIAAWDSEALSFLSDQFKAGTVRKTYAAIVKGRPERDEGFISSNIVRDRVNRKRFTVSDCSGRSAITHYRVVRTAGCCSLLKLRPKTGRTHQIRVHLRSIGHPIIGDPVYGPPAAFTAKLFRELEPPEMTLALHAKTLELVLPGAGPSRFVSALPHRFKKLLLFFGAGRL